jgi:hypothetical protein
LSEGYVATVWQYAEDMRPVTERRLLPKVNDPLLVKMLRAVADVCKLKPNVTIHDAAAAVQDAAR